MPTPATCPHCGHVTHLPDGWAHPGFTCPACNRAAPLPGRPLPPPVLVVAPPAADPFAFDEPRVVEQHRYDHTPPRPAFGTAFGAGAGCTLGVAAAAALILAAAVGLMVLLCAGAGGVMRDAPPPPPAQRAR